MEYKTSAEIAKIWQVSERSVRNYCAQGRVPGSIVQGKSWLIPDDAQKPERQVRHSNAMKERNLLEILKLEKESRLRGGLYHRLQVDLTYSSNHIEGSRLNHEQTRFIFETRTLGLSNEVVNVDDIIETVNHFRCIDVVIDGAKSKLSESFIKQLHFILKSGTDDSRKSWFRIGDYKMLANEVGVVDTASPEDVKDEIRRLLDDYNSKSDVTLDDILDFHVRFERIHPFQDGNGRVGRLIILKECLKYNIVPFIITEELKMFYCRGLKEWDRERGYLRDTCLTAQDAFKELISRYEKRC